MMLQIFGTIHLLKANLPFASAGDTRLLTYFRLNSSNFKHTNRNIKNSEFRIPLLAHHSVGIPHIALLQISPAL